MQIELTLDQISNLLKILTATVRQYESEAAALLTYTGTCEDLARDLARERLEDANSASELTALLSQL